MQVNGLEGYVFDKTDYSPDFDADEHLPVSSLGLRLLQHLDHLHPPEARQHQALHLLGGWGGGGFVALGGSPLRIGLGSRSGLSGSCVFFWHLDSLRPVDGVRYSTGSR